MRVLLLFQSEFLLFHLFFSSLIAVAKTYKTVLNSCGEFGHPRLIPDFRGNAFSFSPLRIMFAVGLSYMTFLRYVPSMPGMLNFKPAFSLSSFTSSKGFLVPLQFLTLGWCHLHI